MISTYLFGLTAAIAAIINNPGDFSPLASRPSDTAYETPFGITITGPDTYYAAGSIVENKQSYLQTLKSTDAGKTWTEVDRDQLAVGKDGRNYGITSDSAGNIYTIGLAPDANDVVHTIIRKSADQGKSWTRVLDFLDPDSRLLYNRGYRIYASKLGDIYAVIQVYSNTDYRLTTDSYGVILKSSDQGTTWTVADRLKDYNPHFITEDKNGNLITLGLIMRDYSTFYGDMLLRTAKPDGTDWKNADELHVSGGSFAMALTYDSNGIGHIAGKKWNGNAWSGFIRTYDDAKGSWEYSKEDFNIGPSFDHIMTPYGIAQDAQGVLWVTGYSTDTNKKTHWFHMKKAPSDLDWQMTMDWVGTEDVGAYGFGFEMDPYRHQLISFGIENSVARGRIWTLFRQE